MRYFFKLSGARGNTAYGAVILLVCALLLGQPFFAPYYTKARATGVDGPLVSGSQLPLAAELEQAREHIVKNNLPAVFFERLAQFEETHRAEIEGGIAPVKNPSRDTPPEGNNPHPFRVLGADKTVKKEPVQSFQALKQSSNANNAAGFSLKQGSPRSFVENLTSVLSSSFSGEQAGASIDSSDEGGEIIFTQSIKDQAAALNNDPLKILNFVRNSIAFEPYYGSKKGAHATLLERSGNDADQAALLIALLRVGDSSGNKKTPARYRQATTKIDLRSVMDLVGVEDPIVAAQVLGQAKIPYTLYVDQNNTPQFFVVEHVYAEALIEYNEYQGAVQSGTGAKQWIPLDPTLMATYFFHSTDVIEDMKQKTGFSIEAFYDKYLNGGFGTQKPIEALRQEITSYLAANAPDKTYADILIQKYRQSESLEFIPRTLSYDVITDLGTYDLLPAAFRHTLSFQVKNSSTLFLDYTAYVSDIAQKELVLAYAPSTQADQDFLNSFESIYDVKPLSLLHLKPVLRARGVIIAGGSSSAPDMQAGRTSTLVISFLMPKRGSSGALENTTADTISKDTVAGNAEGIAIDIGNIIPPEVSPTQDTSSSEFLPSQKLFRTALNYLDRLEAHHDELADIIGVQFTDVATRAIVFNGIDVAYVGSEPFSFSWKGLRIDSSSVVGYYNHFGSDVNKGLKEFAHVFGLEASLDESSIFEEDFGIESMSTVKGIRLINQGGIPGARVVKITQANSSIIDTLTLSDAIKQLFYNEVAKGNTIYTPSAPFTFQNWTGLVYININPTTGFGGYIIGEGLNGGYTVGAWISSAMEWFKSGKVSSIEAILSLPKTIYKLGEKIVGSILYKLFSGSTLIYEFTEVIDLDTEDLGEGTVTIKSRYGTNTNETTTIDKPVIPPSGAASGIIALYAYITTATQVNVRSEPTTKKDTVTTIANKQEVKIIDEAVEGEYLLGLSNIWHKISYRGVSGYVLSSFIELDGQASSTVKTTISTKATELNVAQQEARALAYCESRFKPYARSFVAAKGIYQLMPITVEDINDRLGGAIANPYNPSQNIDGGLRYFKWLRDHYINSQDALEKAIAAWNWGIGNVPVGGPLPSLPAETQGLISCVLSYDNQP